MTDRASLFWLPATPEDFSGRLADALDAPSGLGAALQRLAQHSLNGNKLNRLAKALRRARGEGRSLAPLGTFRLGLLSNSTTALVAPAIEASALRHGLALEVVEAPFGQVMQEALDPQATLATTGCDAILVALDQHGVALKAAPGNREAAAAAVDSAVAQLAAIRQGLRASTGATILVQTIARTPETLFGSYDFRQPGTPRWLIDQYNRAIADSLEDDEILVDVAALAENVGLDHWHDPVQRHLAKLPFAQEMVPVYADTVARVLGAMRGKSRRALVLDLDNTLWGGIIGDDGLDGIAIGQGNAIGEAHLSVQQAALDLHARGVVLAVSSKNEDAAARGPFRDHAEMLLREEHFAIFQANWIDKATNLATIAAALNLGRDSLVFLDDNPAERMQVRAAHPEIAVPELPGDAALYVRALTAAGYFEALTFSDDDRARAGFYQDNARRLQLQSGACSLDDYHRSLEMVVTFQPFDTSGRSRIAQLVSKSNQFNLTTRRYTEAQVAELEADPSSWTLQARLADVFGDNGMIAVVVCCAGTESWEIDSWLMSCRVLGRRMEDVILQEIVRAARAAGAHRVVGRYVPTERNAMVAGHYEKMGFTKDSDLLGGGSIWSLDLSTYEDRALPMTIVRPAELG